MRVLACLVLVAFGQTGCSSDAEPTKTCNTDEYACCNLDVRDAVQCVNGAPACRAGYQLFTRERAAVVCQYGYGRDTGADVSSGDAL